MRFLPTGDVIDDINDVITGVRNVKDAVNPALEILADPYFPQVVGKIAELHAIEVREGGSGTRGVGLRHLVYPLGLYVEYRKSPILMGALILAVAVGIPMAIGYALGKGYY